MEHRITFHTGSQLSYMVFPTLIINKKKHTAVTAPVPSLLPRLFAFSMQCKMPFPQIFSLGQRLGTVLPTPPPSLLVRRPGNQQQNDKCPPISVPWVSLSKYAYPSVETKLPQLVGSGNEKPAGKLGMPLGSVPMPKGNVEETPCPSWGRSR